MDDSHIFRDYEAIFHQSNSDNASIDFILAEKRKTSFSFTTMPGLTAACAHVRQTEMGWTVLPHPAHSPNLAPSDLHLFGPVEDALLGRHFANDNKLKESFHDVPRSPGREFF
jgi:hypothetical protein